MAPIAAPVRKDTLEKESHAKVKLVRLWKSRITVHLLQIDCVHNTTMIAMYVILMLTVQTLMVLITASVRKDTLQMDSLANVD